METGPESVHFGFYSGSAIFETRRGHRTGWSSDNAVHSHYGSSHGGDGDYMSGICRGFLHFTPANAG
jgi:hypothetical protein